jgi:hypothetical protein
MKARATTHFLTISVLACALLACNYVTSLVNGGGGATEVPSLLKDDFSDNSSGWGTGTDSDSSIEYVDGGLHMKISKDNFFTWSHPDEKTYQDVHMEVTVRNDGEDPNTAFGLMCNQDGTNNSYYYFAVTAGGEYVIGKSEAGKDDVFLTNNDAWAKSDLIEPNASSYRVGADCSASGALTLYVDGKKVASVNDTSYASGEVGLFLWSGDKPAGEVTYDDFEMRALK